MVKPEDKCYLENSYSSEKNQPEPSFPPLKYKMYSAKFQEEIHYMAHYTSRATVPNTSAILASFCSNLLGIRGNFKLQKAQVGRKTPAPFFSINLLIVSSEVAGSLPISLSWSALTDRSVHTSLIE